MAVGKLAKLFSAFKPASASAKLTKAVQKGKLPNIFVQHLQSVENESVRESLMKYLSRFAKNTDPEAFVKNLHSIDSKPVEEPLIKSLLNTFTKGENALADAAKIQLDDIVFKLQQCEDAVIKSKAEELLIQAGKKHPREALKLVTKAEMLLDSANCASGKYTTLFDLNAEYKYSSKLFRQTINENKKEIEVIKNKINEISERIANAANTDKLEEALKLEQEYCKLSELEKGYSEVYKQQRLVKQVGAEFPADMLEPEAKLQNLKQFIEAHPKDSETATYLWRKYFVSGLDTGSQRILNDIYDQFGVRIINPHGPLSKMEFARVREELLQYKKALGKKVKMPPFIEIRRYRDYFSRTNYAFGIRSQSGNIVLADNVLLYTGNKASGRHLVLRHEMAHLQDRKCYSKIKPIMELIKKIFRPKITKELKNAGINGEHLEYAFVKSCETKAVFAEGDMNRYSKTFKRMMTNRISGLPKGMRNLQDVSPEKCELLAGFWGRQNYKVIDQLEEILQGGISREVANVVANNPDYIKLIRSICKKVPKGTKLSQQDFIKIFETRIQQQREYLAKARNSTIDCIKASESVPKSIIA